MQTLISHDNHLAIFAVMAAMSVFGMWAEGKKWAFNISGVVFTILMMALLAYLGIVPSASGENPVLMYDFAFDYIIPLAIPLLLFNASIRKIVKETGPLLGAYLIGTIGVVLGALLAYLWVPLPEEGAQLTGVFISTFIGGSVNFLATSETLNFSQSPRFVTAIAVDNFLFSLFVAGLFVLPSLRFIQKYFIVEPREDLHNKPEQNQQEASITKDQEITLTSITTSLAIAGAICGISHMLKETVQQLLHTNISLYLLIITLLIIIVANTFSEYMQKFEKTAFTLGFLLMYLFLAAIGASCDPRQVLATGPEVLLYAVIILTVHLAFLLLAGKLLGIGVRTLAIASSANIGGPGVSAPMAAGMGQHSQITAAILVGILGYVIGTFLGVSVGLWLG